MGGCQSTTAIEPMPQKGFCMCGAKAFGKTINHTIVEHELANIILQYYRKKLNSKKEIGGYIWTLQFIKDKFKKQSVNVLVGMDDFPKTMFPNNLLLAWTQNVKSYTTSKGYTFEIHTI